ncbi:MAG: ABC transporter ATP-binding protein [Clostridia bacterium]
MESIVKIKDLTKSYKKSRGVENINIEIEKGTIYGFIGPNGAGKSTTIKCIMNMINKNSGDIYIDSKLMTRSNNKIKEKIGYLPSEIHLYDDLTVKKMLDYSASFYKKDCTKRKDELVKRLEIDTAKKINELSLGNLKKVGIVLAIMHEPEFIIMDEATSALDPLMQEIFYEILSEEKKKGTTIFFSSHMLNEVKRICDKVAIIKEGKIIRIDDIQKLNDSSFVKVKLTSKEVDDIIDDINITISNKKGNEIEFIYKDDINDFIKKLSKYEVSKVLIEEPNIEEIFINYYK